MGVSTFNPRGAGLEVLGEIGRGAQAVVYRARRDGTDYALKVLRHSDDPARAAVFRRQAALLACVSDPGLPRVHTAGSTEGRPYVLMDLVDGESLARRLTRGPLAEPEAISIGAGVASALAAAHAVNLVHRDVKPDNILITAGQRAKLVDFGLATPAESGPRDADQDALMAGTLTYSPPEQSGMLNRPVDGRSDLYALGVVLFECVTGAVPFAAADVGELLRLHATAPVPDPRALAPRLSATLAAIIVRLLAKDPDDRYQSGAGLLADLRRLAAGPDQAFPPGLDDGPPTVGSAALTGRDAESAALRARWESARTGNCGIVAVTGEAGSGKTRLVTELAAEPAVGAPIVLHGRSTSGDRRPLAPIRAAIEAYVRLRPASADVLRAAAGPAAALVKNLSPALAEVLAAPDVDGQIGPDRHARAVAGFLTGLARAGGPMLLHLDDAQWFDEGTVRVLDQLATETARTPLLVVVTSRTPVPAADTTITLAPLNADQVADLLDAQAGGVRCDPQSAARIATLTGGNPFTVLEYARAVMDAGLVQPVWGHWEAVDGLRDLRLPADSAQLMLRRMGELDAAGRRLLGIAAVVGTRFTADLVIEAAGADPDRVDTVLAHAGRQGLIEGRRGAYTFMHESIRTALTAGFTDAQIHDLHDRIALALDRRGPGSDVYALAQHCAAGNPLGDPVRTLRAGYAAGALAMAEHAPGTAAVFLEQALATADQAGLPVSSGFRQLLGAAYHYTGRFGEALTTLTAALDRTSDPIERARVYSLLARVHDRAWNGVAELEAVEAGLAELGRPMPRNAALLVLSSIWLLILGGVIRVTRLGYGTARGDQRDRYLLQAALSHHGASGSLRCLRPVRALLYGIRLVHPMNRLGRTSERAQDMVAITLAIRMAGLHRVADRIIRAATRLADELGDPTLGAYIAWMDAVARHGSGRDQGEGLKRVLAERDRWLDPGLALDCYAVLGWDWLLRGEVAEAESAFAGRQKWIDAGGHADRSAIVAIDASMLALHGRAGEAAAATARVVRNAGQVHEVVDALIVRLQTALERDDLGAAFDEAAAEFAALGLKPLDLLPAQHAFYVYLAYGRVGQGEYAAARAAVSLLAKVTRRPLIAAHHRVLVAALDRPEAALRSLARAEPVLRSVDAPLVAYEAAVVRARALTVLGVPGEAARQVRTALSIATEYGWPHRARRLAVEFPIETRSPGRAPGAGTVGGAARRSALEQVSLAASRILDPHRLTRITLDETVRLLGAERAFLFLMDPDTQILSPYAGRDATGHDLPELSGYSATVVDQVRHSRQAIVVTGTEEGEALGARSVAMYGLRSILVAPLQLEDRLLGVVYLDSRIAKGVFTVDDVDLLTAITHHIAVALETARAAQLEVAVSAANRQRDLAETLRAAMARLSGLLDPHLVLRELLDTALETPGGDHGWLLDVATHPDSLGDFGSRLTVALADRDGPVGTLVLASDRADAYSDADLGIAQALAGQAMVAYDNARLFSRVAELATTDSLTGLANRRQFFTLAPALVAAGAGVALMLDIDNFKQVNDTYGHQAGDDVIRGVVDHFRAAVPAGALLGRYGGEEFALLVPVRSGELGESLRAAVSGSAIETRRGPVSVTVSVGSAVIRPGDTIDSVLGRADAALYEAKQAGRNRVVAHLT